MWTLGSLESLEEEKSSSLKLDFSLEIVAVEILKIHFQVLGAQRRIEDIGECGDSCGRRAGFQFQVRFVQKCRR